MCSSGGRKGNHRGRTSHISSVRLVGLTVRRRPSRPGTGDPMHRDLVERAMAGDRDAFTELTRGSIGQLHAVARLILRDRERAEDATQEALVAAWRQLSALRDPDRFDAWLRAYWFEPAIAKQARTSVNDHHITPPAHRACRCRSGHLYRRSGRAGACIQSPEARQARTHRPSLLPRPADAGDFRDPRDPCRHREIPPRSYDRADAGDPGSRCAAAASC